MPHWLKYPYNTLSNTPIRNSGTYETLSTTSSLQTRQSLRQCAYIITQVIAAPKLAYLHERACHCDSKILGGQNLLQGLSNYTPSSVPLRSLHHYFLTHGCICGFIFYGYGIMGENRGAFHTAVHHFFFPMAVTKQCFILPQGSL